MMTAAIDNDILFKGACYGLLFDLISAIPSSAGDVGVLGAAKYVVSSKLRKVRLAQSVGEAAKRLEKVLRTAQVLEPTTDEQRYAAELEAAAQRANLSFDTGESQLCAIVITRAMSRLVTGDKRAIKALEWLLAARGETTKLAGKVLCLEQLLLRLIKGQHPKNVRSAVCEEPAVDKALTTCFSCYSPEIGPESWSEGLMSYIGDLRGAAPILLAE